MRALWQSRGRKPSKGSVNATAILTIKMSDLGSWGSNYQMDQIMEQARDAAIDRIRRYAQNNRDHVEVLDVKITAMYLPEGGL